MLPTRPSTSYPKRLALSGRCDAVMDGTGWVLVLMAFTAALTVGLTVRDIRRNRRRASQTSGGCGFPDLATRRDARAHRRMGINRIVHN